MMKGMAQNSSSQVWVIRFSVGLIVVQLKVGFGDEGEMENPRLHKPSQVSLGRNVSHQLVLWLAEKLKVQSVS